MGVIINETITLDNGLTVTNPYASLEQNTIMIEKKADMTRTVYNRETGKNTHLTTIKYVVTGHFNMWLTQEMSVAGKKSIGVVNVTVETDTPPTGNIYDILYNKLKTMKTCTDAI
jgi:hypothetical protein